MSDVEPADPPAVLGEEPIAEPLAEEAAVVEDVVEEVKTEEAAVAEVEAEAEAKVEEVAEAAGVAEEPVEKATAEESAVTSEPVAVPEPEEGEVSSASDPEPPSVIAVEEATPIAPIEPTPTETVIEPAVDEDVPIEIEPRPKPEEALDSLQKVASTPVNAELVPMPVQETVADTSLPATTPVPETSVVETGVAKAAAAADVKSLAPSRKERAKAKLLGKMVPKVAALRAPKEAVPVMLLLTQKKKAGADIAIIVGDMLRVAGA